IATMVDEFPTDAIRIEIGNDRRWASGADGTPHPNPLPIRWGEWDRRSRTWLNTCTKYNSRHLLQILFLSQGLDEAEDSFFAFAAHKEVNGRLLLNDVGPVVGRKDTAINNPCIRNGGARGPRDAAGHRMA